MYGGEGGKYLACDGPTDSSRSAFNTVVVFVFSFVTSLMGGGTLTVVFLTGATVVFFTGATVVFLRAPAVVVCCVCLSVFLKPPCLLAGTTTLVLRVY